MNGSLLITQPQAARLLGVSVATVKRMATEGRLERVYLRRGAHPRFRRKDIEGLAASASRAP